MPNKYLERFFALRCHSDVLDTVGHIKFRDKEITEAMAMIRHIQRIVLRDKRPHFLLDLCAGNALVSVLATYLLPQIEAVAIDNQPRERNWGSAERFRYINDDIFNNPIYIYEKVENPIIIVGCHACNALAHQIIKHYVSFGDYLVLMPCCNGSEHLQVPSLFRERLSSYEQWSYTLYHEVEQHSAQCNMIADKNVMSPKNIIITAQKE